MPVHAFRWKPEPEPWWRGFHGVRVSSVDHVKRDVTRPKQDVYETSLTFVSYSLTDSAW